MVKEVKINGKKYFMCKFCRLIYKDRKPAEELCKKINILENISN